MTVFANFALGKREDASLRVQLQNVTDTNAWNVQLTVARRFGGSGFLSKNPFSNDSLGEFRFAINAVDTSGLAFGNYAYEVTRIDTGGRIILTQGYIFLLPNVG